MKKQDTDVVPEDSFVERNFDEITEISYKMNANTMLKEICYTIINKKQTDILSSDFCKNKISGYYDSNNQKIVVPSQSLILVAPILLLETGQNLLKRKEWG